MYIYVYIQVGKPGWWRVASYVKLIFFLYGGGYCICNAKLHRSSQGPPLRLDWSQRGWVQHCWRKILWPQLGFDKGSKLAKNGSNMDQFSYPRMLCWYGRSSKCTVLIHTPDGCPRQKLPRARNPRGLVLLHQYLFGPGHCHMTGGGCSVAKKNRDWTNKEPTNQQMINLNAVGVFRFFLT